MGGRYGIEALGEIVLVFLKRPLYGVGSAEPTPVLRRDGGVGAAREMQGMRPMGGRQHALQGELGGRVVERQREVMGNVGIAVKFSLYSVGNGCGVVEEERKPAAGGIEDKHRVAHARERAGGLLFPVCEEKHAGVFGVFYLPKLREVESAATFVPIAGKVEVAAAGFERIGA